MATSTREVPDAHCYVIQRGLLCSLGLAQGRVDLRLPPLGLTVPPKAVTPLPEAKIRKASFFMLMAA